MTRRLAQPPSGLHAPVVESGSKPVITTGSCSQREPTSTGVVDGGKIVMKPTQGSTGTNSTHQRHEEYMRTRMKQEDAAAKSKSMKSLPETSSDEDAVNRPAHYNQSGIECIDAIRAALGPEGFRNYCTGNALKYVWRHPYKNGKEDVEKAIVYLTWLAEAYDE